MSERLASAGNFQNNPNSDANGSIEENNQVENLPDAIMELILEFQAVSGIEDMDESRRILASYDWDLLNAIAGHIPDSQIQTPSETRQRSLQSQSSNIQNSTSQLSSSSSINRNSPPIRYNGGLFSRLWRLISAPGNFILRYVWDLIGFGLSFLQSDPRRAITDPVADVATFISRFETDYGTIHPTFYEGTYGQALNDTKRELKFLLVYLQSDQHSDTQAFCQNVLTNPDLIDFVRANMLFWACSVSTPEGYRTSQALRENSYPFLALIVLKNHRMTIVSRIEGVTDPTLVLNRLHQAVADNEAFLVAERQDRLERSMTQTLREQQDAAYQESLKADREKERRKREQNERKRQEELEKQRIIDDEIARKKARQELKKQIRENLQPEPEPNEDGVVRVVIKLPSGTRLERRFRKSDSIKHLYFFVFSNQEAPDSFEIATNFPKRNLLCKPSSELPDPPSFIESGLGPKEMLFVYDLES